MDVPAYKLVGVVLGTGSVAPEGERVPVFRIGYVSLDEPASNSKDYIDFALPPGDQGVRVIIDACQKFLAQKGAKP